MTLHDPEYERATLNLDRPCSFTLLNSHCSPTVMIWDAQVVWDLTPTTFDDGLDVPTKPKKYHWYASRYLCAMTLGVVAWLAGRHLYRLVDRKRRLGQPEGSKTEAPRRPHHRPLRSAYNAFHRGLFLSSMPRWISSPESVADAVSFILLAVNPMACECLLGNHRLPAQWPEDKAL
jgi:hypothetical protein